ncbi:hypothetical protein CY34DRAFT_594455 [Suillus luteus UH-Slu-Lm8-n1]|uniref:Uncharacterized protein n=1 Tax=Suillus luteus UH-Slu-Lm8-n1 TaxID=930992 RepID=A0A0D0B4H0_9AGAM|nr:hypothetical protein CY34DRAFT_594455 [Suillus luteus UH-Slu-Lm8-n1]
MRGPRGEGRRLACSHANVAIYELRMSDRYVTGASSTLPRSGEGLVAPTNQVEDQRLEIRNHCEEAAAGGEIVPKHGSQLVVSSNRDSYPMRRESCPGQPNTSEIIVRQTE